MPIPRKILIRVVGAPILLALLGAILWSDYGSRFNPGLRVLLVVVGGLSAWEFFGLCRAKGIETASVAGTAAVVVLLMPWHWLLNVLQWTALGGDAVVARNYVRVVLVLYVLVNLAVRHGKFTVEGAAFTLAGFFYVGLLELLTNPPVSMSPKAAWWYLIFLVAANKGSDMAAYVVGKSMGRHKMTPVLSPNKTWEGAAGGMIGGTGAALAVILCTELGRAVLANVPFPVLLMLAALVTMAAQVGDLVESAFKRWAGVKDSGRLLPEFGGILDMVDSFLISVPVSGLAFYLVIDTYRRAS